MHRTHDPGTTNCTEGAHAANRHFMPEPTARYNAGIQYSRLTVADPGFSKWGGAVLSQMGGCISCF